MGMPQMEELILSDSEVDAHVKNALKLAAEFFSSNGLRGDLEHYNQLVSGIHHKENLDVESAACLVARLNALTASVSCIDTKHHHSLVAAICEMRLWDYGTDVMDALTELLVALASSSGEFLDFCLTILVLNFLPRIDPKTKKLLNIHKKPQVLDRVHSALRSIVHVVPLSPVRLEKIVAAAMPKLFFLPLPLALYVENMLRLESDSMVGSNMLIYIMDKLVELDVEIPWDENLRDDKDLFDNCEGDNMDRFNVSKTAENLDTLMVLTLEHLNGCSENGRLVQVFGTLLQSFQKTVLTAYKSKFAQFIVFYACSLDPENCGIMFASLLIDIFVNYGNPQMRMSAVAYLASFLSRSKFVTIPFVAIALERVVTWCLKYIKSQKQGGDINPKAHKVFYAGCQATMYVLCFRMRQMLALPQLNSQELFMQIENILGHSLNPLQVCLPTIVREFLSLANANHIFSTPRIFDNDCPLDSEHSRTFGGTERLDMFFPFDPCQLRKCDSFIRPNYVYWSMIKGMCDNDYEEEEEEEGSSDEDEIATGMSIPNNGSNRGSHDDENFEDDEFDYSLDKMSITPRDISTIQRYMQMPSKIRPSMSPESI